MFEDARICAIFNLVRILYCTLLIIEQIACDLPYHGQTTVNSSTFARKAESYPIRETAEILVGALKLLHVEHVNVLGISHLGLVGCELAGGWPEMVCPCVAELAAYRKGR